jgi:hypothetical protein
VDLATGHQQARVAAGDGRRVHPHRGVVRPAEDVLALAQRDLAILAAQPEGWTAPPRPLVGRALDAAAEGIAVAVHCPHQTGMTSVVPQGRAELAHQAGQVRFGDERARPEPVTDLLLRDGARTLGDEQGQKVEGLGREGDFLPRAEHLARGEIEHAVGERDAHVRPRKKAGRTPGFPEDFRMLAAQLT